MIRIYQIICKACGGSGYIPKPDINETQTTTPLTIVCPACKGSGTQNVTEQHNDNGYEHKFKFDYEYDGKTLIDYIDD